MYTVKRFIHGDIFIHSEKTVHLSPVGGRGFNEAITLHHTEDSSSFPTHETEYGQTYTGTLSHRPDTEMEPSSVENNISFDGTNVVVKSMREGNRDIASAIGVLISTTVTGISDEGAENNIRVCYDFIYPGDEVYVVNSEGNTVQSLR